MPSLTRRDFLGSMGAATALAWAGCGDDGEARSSLDAAVAPDAAVLPPDAALADGSSPAADAAADAAPQPDAAPAQLTGRVLRPGDPGWDAARQNANLRFDVAPRAIVFAQTVDDVANAIRWARENRVPLRARSGRHSYEGWSLVADGLVVDVSPMNAVAHDRASGRARIGAGANLGTVYEALAEEGATIPAGSCVSVGVAGLALGGGIGLLARLHGLTCDRLVAIELVDAAGRALRASADENPDLFWALRGGGGGNFGIVTAFEFATVPAADVATYTASWPLAALPELLTAWQSVAPAADPAFMSVLTLGQRKITSVGQLVGSTAQLQAILAPLVDAATPANLTVQSLAFIEAVRAFGGDYDDRSTFKNSSAYVRAPFSGDGIAALQAVLAAAPGPSNALQLDAMRGRIAAVAPDATAFPHRDALCSMQLHATWTDPDDATPNRAWIRDTRAALAAYTSGAYVNYPDADLAQPATLYYGANLARLSSVKRRYDPDGFFDFPQAIPA